MKEQFKKTFKKICGFSDNIPTDIPNRYNQSMIDKFLEKIYIDKLREATIIFMRLSDIEKERLIARVRKKHANSKKEYIIDPAEWHWIAIYYSGFWILEDKKN